MRLYRSLDVAQLLHERFINLQAACRIDDDDIICMRCRVCDRSTRNGNSILLPLREHRHIDLSANNLKLLDRSGPIDIISHKERALALFLQHESKLAGRGRLSRSLKTRKHDDGRRIRTDVETALRPPHQCGEFLVDDLNDRLCSGEGIKHILSDRAFLDAFHKVLDDLEIDIGLEECHAHLAHRIIDIFLCQLAVSAHFFENALQAIRQILKDHSLTSFISFWDVYCSSSSAMRHTSTHAIGSLSARRSAQTAASACSCAC